MFRLMKNKKRFILGLITIISIALVLVLFIFRNNTVEALSKYGSRGNEVTQIQTKLKRWGYYNGAIDGVYGSKTLAAVKDFQRKNGLTVDGIIGRITWTAIEDDFIKG